MEKNRTDPGLHRWIIPEIQTEFAVDSMSIMVSEVFPIFFIQHWGLFHESGMAGWVSENIGRVR
jgi:hypothetical protein